MEKEFETKLRKNRNLLKGIGILEITGGITGLGLILWLTLQGAQTNTFVLLILLFAVGFYVYSIFAGIKLFKYMENGVLHSQILQYMQIPTISLGGITYLLTSGGYLFVGYNFTEETLNFNFALIASKFQINIMRSGESEFMSLNMLAIIVLAILEKSREIIKEQNAIKENYEKNITEWLETKSELKD